MDNIKLASLVRTTVKQTQKTSTLEHTTYLVGTSEYDRPTGESSY